MKIMETNGSGKVNLLESRSGDDGRRKVLGRGAEGICSWYINELVRLAYIIVTVSLETCCFTVQCFAFL